MIKVSTDLIRIILNKKSTSPPSSILRNSTQDKSFQKKLLSGIGIKAKMIYPESIIKKSICGKTEDTSNTGIWISYNKFSKQIRKMIRGVSV